MINTVISFFFTPIQDKELFVAFKLSVKRAFILKKFFRIKNLGGLKEVTGKGGRVQGVRFFFFQICTMFRFRKSGAKKIFLLPFSSGIFCNWFCLY